MLSPPVRLGVVVLAAGSLIGLAEADARACGPSPSSPSPDCTTLLTHAPGAQFPVDLAGSAIRVSLFEVEDGLHRAVVNGFPLAAPLEVFRETASGLEPAPFTLEEGAGLVANARTLRLVDPQPGRHHVAWAGDTCRVQPASAGEGKEVGVFTLSPSAALPKTLGALAATPSTMRARDFQEGVAGDCSPIMIHLEEAESSLTLTPSAELAPWVDAITTALEVDGQIVRGFAKPDPALLADGRFTIPVVRICASDTPRYLAQPGIAEGRHVARMRAQIEGLAEIASTETTFEVRCNVPRADRADDGTGRPPAGSSSSSSSEGGCAVAARATSASGVASLGVVAAVAATLARRRRLRARRD